MSSILFMFRIVSRYLSVPRNVAQLGLVTMVGWLVALPMAAQADVTLTFGTYAADKPTDTVRKYHPFLTFLADRMSVELDEPVTIKMKIAKEYDAGIDHLAASEVDFARFGPASYVHVMDRNSEIQLVAMESKNGGKRFNGVIVVHADSDIHSLEQLSGQSFAFGDELSTIGRYLAQSHLLEAGISSAELQGFDYLGRHDLVGEAVGAGRFTAGALKESTYKKLVAKGVPIRVLLSFDNVTKPWLASAEVSPRIVAAMRRVMLASDNQETVQQILKNGFLEGTDDDYNFVRQAMDQSRLF